MALWPYFSQGWSRWAIAGAQNGSSALGTAQLAARLGWMARIDRDFTAIFGLRLASETRLAGDIGGQAPRGRAADFLARVQENNPG